MTPRTSILFKLAASAAVSRLLVILILRMAGDTKTLARARRRARIARLLRRTKEGLRRAARRIAGRR